jgi:AGZA family xanthine/uracil permease-like MFS transporter
MPATPERPMQRYPWATRGDVNAFFGLMLDNVANLSLMVGLLAGGFGFPASFALRYMIPGTALGVLAGDLAFTWMAFRLARSTGRNTITAMPLGLDTPSTFGMVFFVLGPAYQAAKSAGMSEEAAATQAWHIGMCAIIASGVFKLACSFASAWVRRIVPRAGLLGSLTAIALVLISFLPLLEMMAHPVVGMVSLAIILATLVARIELPGRMPGALAALLAGGTIYYLMKWTGLLGHPPATPAFEPTVELLLPHLAWVSWDAWQESFRYLPIVLPFALATVVGGIDCTESAAAAGDEYHTGHVIAVEAVATLIAGFSGGVIQTTPYIGHPAYKAMGGRAAYTLATALTVGVLGMSGLFGYFYQIVPQAAIFPILVFVGLEITAQSFHATPVKHFPAVALACVPAMAYLVLLFGESLLTQSGLTIDQLQPPLNGQFQTLRNLSAGFVVTSLLWASALAAIIDRRLRLAGTWFAVAGLFSLFGVIHSPLPGSPLFLPWRLPALPAAAAGQSPVYLAAGYGLAAMMLWAWGALRHDQPKDHTDDA